MSSPLPIDTIQVIDANKDAVTNLFLLYYKYTWTWTGNNEWEMRGEEKGAMMKALKKAARAKEIEMELSAFIGRHRAMVFSLGDEGWKPRTLDLVTDARLIAGLGYKGPMEVGLTLHPLYGFPYIPASSIKGIARAYAQRVLKEDEGLIREIFGSPDKDAKRADEFRVGCVRFFDAIPIKMPVLDIDIMTPHFGKYYMDGQTPGDWLSPVPVAFLAVAEEQAFHFSLAARADTDSSKGAISPAQADEYADKARKWLKEGLESLGAGGKTAAGYGFFTDADAKAKRVAELEELALTWLEAPKVTRPPSLPRMKSVGQNSTRVPAQVKRREGNMLVVRLNVDGYDDSEFKLGGVKAEYMPDGSWMYVNVAGYSPKTRRVTAVSYAGLT